MTILFKTAAEQEQHFFNIWDSIRAVTPSGSITRKETGKISRNITDSMGVIDGSIPGTETSRLMEKYAQCRTGVTYTCKTSKAGRSLNSTLSW
jgi:hypothetical protein